MALAYPVLSYTRAMVRISLERIKILQALLKEQTGNDYSDEEAQEAWLNIMRFALVKEQRRQEPSKQQKLTAPKDVQ